MAVASRTRFRRAARALLASSAWSLALVAGAVFVQRLALPLAVLGLGRRGYGAAFVVLVIAAAFGFLRARAADRLSARVRLNLIELYLAPFERGDVITLPSSDVVTARLATSLPALVNWAVDGVAVMIAALLAVPLVAGLLAYTLGPTILIPLGVAGIAGGLFTWASARRVERAWTRAWERSRTLLVSTSAGFAGAIDLRAHGQSQAFAARLRDEARRWSASEGSARIESALSTWGALLITLGAGLATGLLLGSKLVPEGKVYETLLLVLAAVPTLQTLVSGFVNVIGARDELDHAGQQQVRASEATLEESEEPFDATAEINLDRIAYSYGANEGEPTPALRDTSLLVPAKQSVAVMGPNGAGKTTLLHVLLGILRPDRGSIRVAGDPARLDNRHFRDRIAFVSQRPFMLPESSLAENLRAFDPSTNDARLVDALKTVGLWSSLRARASSDTRALALPIAQLSAGQARRVMLARALLRDADLLVLDEPEAHLDAESVAELSTLLERLARDRRIVAVVHDRALTAFASQVTTLEAPSQGEPLPR